MGRRKGSTKNLRARIGVGGGTQGPRQCLEAAFNDVVVVLAVKVFYVQRYPRVLGEGLKPFLEQLGIHLAQLGL